MKYTSIIDKLICLYNILISSWIDGLVLGIIFLLFILIISKKLSKGIGIIFMLVIYLSFGLFTVYLRYDNLSVIFNSLIDNMFTSIYFPSVYVYLFVLSIINIIFIVGTLNRRLGNIYKIINGITFGIINFLFIIILDIIGEHNVNIFNKLSLFGNSDLVMMLEFSVGIFIAWAIMSFAVYAIDKLTEAISIHNYSKEPVKVIEPILEVSNVDDNVVEEETITSFLPKNVVTPVSVVLEPIPPIPPVKEETSDNSFNLPDFVAPKQELKPIVDKEAIMEKILNNNLPVITEEKSTLEKDSFTLNDYKMFNNMLKDIKDFNQSNIIQINKNLEYRLITKYSNESYNLFKRMLKTYSN